MDITKLNKDDIENLKLATIANFEKKNKNILDKLGEEIEKSVINGQNKIDIEFLFPSFITPDGLLNYLSNKGFHYKASLSGKLYTISW